MPLSDYAKQHGIKYFLISFVDLFGTMRAKIVPATAIDSVAKLSRGEAAERPDRAVPDAEHEFADRLHRQRRPGRREAGWRRR